MLRSKLEVVLFSWLLVQAANASVVITLDARDANGAPLPPQVAAGTAAHVTILLSADGQDNPLPDVRLLQFNVSATSPGIAIQSFEWLVDPSAYFFQDSELPVVAAVSIYFSSSSDLFTLDATPVPVATLDVFINDSGVLDVRNPNTSDINQTAMISAGFDIRRDYTAIQGDLEGGALAFVVAGAANPPSNPMPSEQDNPPGDAVDVDDVISNGTGEEPVIIDDGVHEVIDPNIGNVAPVSEDNGSGQVAGDVTGDSASDAVDPESTDGVTQDTVAENGSSAADNEGDNDGVPGEEPALRPVRLCGVGFLPFTLFIVAALPIIGHRFSRSIRRTWRA